MSSLTNNSSHPYYEGLDALRGVSILLIMFCHYYERNLFFRFGWVSLELFFVLSGFLITSILLHAKKDGNYFKHFYIRRALRIFPIYYLILILFYLAINFYDPSNQFSYYKTNATYYFTYLENMLFVFKGAPKERHLTHFWSLALEEQYYLIWPIIVFFLNNKKKLISLLWKTIICVTLIRIIVCYNWSSNLPAYHCNTFTRIDSIAFGCLLGCGFSFQSMKFPARLLVIITSFLIFVLGFIFFQDTYFTNPVFRLFGYPAAAILICFFLEAYVSHKPRFKFLKGNFVLNYVGKISYAMYLVHMPVYLFVLLLEGRTGSLTMSPELISIVSTIIIATISRYTIELPALQLKALFPMSSKK